MSQASSDWPCAFRGHELSRHECPTCSGKVWVKVLACTLYEACTIQNTIEGIHACSLCTRRKEPEKSSLSAANPLS